MKQIVSSQWTRAAARAALASSPAAALELKLGSSAGKRREKRRNNRWGCTSFSAVLLPASQSLVLQHKSHLMIESLRDVS